LNKMSKYLYTIISDLHLGCGVSNSDKICKLLQSLDTDFLILNGDTLDRDHTKRLKKKDWKILSLLRKKSKHIEIYCVQGNHSPEFDSIISDLLGFNFAKELNIVVKSRRIHISHGDKNDFWTKRKLITNFFTGLYYYIQVLDKNNKITGWIKRVSKKILKTNKGVEDSAFKYAKEHSFTDIIQSHTHYPDKVSKDGINYYNTGSFCYKICTFVTIDHDGKIELQKI